MHSLDWHNFFTFEDQILKDWFQKFTYPWQALERIQDLLTILPKGKVQGQVFSSAHIENPELVFISQGAKVEPFAYIQGPCFIGEGATVRQGAYIRGNVYIGKNAVVGHSSEVKNSLIFDHACAPHFNYVGDSILGHRVNLGAGVVLANLRLDKRAINVRSPEARINTGMRKLGSIIGDDAQIGCNAVMNPGTIIQKGAFCPPCQNSGGFIPSKNNNLKQESL